MPCFKQEKSLEFRSRRDPINDRDPMAPKPVRPRSMRYHGLLGQSIAAQHLIFDEAWTPASLTEEFTRMGDLLQRRVIYKWHETKSNHKRLLVESRKLKTQCADGRTKLQKISSGHNAHKIRNILGLHRDMQRLYQRMPIHLVADNINQRTFVMRKEKDRLEARLSQLKDKYRQLLVDRSKAENLIKYAGECVLVEELQSRVLLRKIENSNVRMKAIRTINITYKKMVQVLLQDEIFYEPIQRSLDDDMEEQANFIKHILFLGMPAISKFKVLNREFRQLEESSRKNIQAKLQILNASKKPVVIGRQEVAIREILTADPKRYVRETQSMEMLKMELQTIEKTIKELKLIALCSQAKEIYPRIKSQVDNNKKLHRKIEHKIMENQMMQTRMKCASMLHDVLVNNLSEEEINRHQRIAELRLTLETDEEFKLETIAYIINRADAFVMLRISLWNFIEMLRSIDRAPRAFRKSYPNDYLKLPLLRFELMEMYSVAPDLYEEDVDVLLHLLKRKVYKLIKAFTPEMREKFKYYNEEYHKKLTSTLEPREMVGDDQQDAVPFGDLLQDRTMASIPSRKQIKAQSARLVEEAFKRDEA